MLDDSSLLILDEATSKEIEGTGLGLAIVKSAADEIGAKIKLENRKPHGLKAILSFRN